MFHSAGEQLYSAARFALYAERMMPTYERLKEIRDTEMPRGDQVAFRLLSRQKHEASRVIPLYQAVLLLEADDG